LAEEISDSVLVIVNLQPDSIQETMVNVPLSYFSLGDADSYLVTDLLSGNSYPWRGFYNYVRLDSAHGPAHIFKFGQ